MYGLPTIDPKTATGKTKELLDAAKANMGRVPNILKALANSPVALEAYLELSRVIKGGAFSPALRECLALAIAERNNCDYCLAAHTALGKMAGLTPEQMEACRRGHSDDQRAAAAIKFALRVLETNGFVTPDDLAAVREAGFGDGEIVEIVAVVTLNVYTNLLNHVANTKLDFPAAPKLEG
jgi:uncharacterized peroxidase-related enzyme